jgi:hypothetical protein
MEVLAVSGEEVYYLAYPLSDGSIGSARFFDINDRDGCHISLDMYRSNLGEVTREVFLRYVDRHGGEFCESPLQS